MTREELKNMAKHQGLVQWNPSGRIERLELRNRGETVVARNVLSGRIHYIRPQENYRCRRIEPQELIQAKDLM